MSLQVTDQMPMGSEGLLEPGDPVPPFVLPDQDGATASPMSDKVAGKPTILIFEGTQQSAGPIFERELAALRDSQAAWRASDAIVFAISRRRPDANLQLHATLGLPFPLLSDASGDVFRAYGLETAPQGCPTVTFVLDPNMRALEILGDGAPESHASLATKRISALVAETPEGQFQRHPPVLVLPGALTPQDCARLIQVWHRDVPVWDTEGLVCEGYAAEKGDFKVRNESYGRVLQFVVRDRQIQTYLDAKLGRRVLSEIQKAFQTKVTRREHYRIASYDAAEGGNLPAHRDNPTEDTKHRRFTVAVTLNAEAFGGGGLRFPEYGRQAYLVPTGTAIVWSCALLHEVLPVISGQRFILGTHLFGTE